MMTQRTENYDIVIIGGGPAGTCAAIAAARKKRHVLLVEKYGFLGGVGTAAMFSPLQGFFAGQKKIIFGIADEIVERLIASNGSRGHAGESELRVTPFDAEVMKYVLQEMVVESGASLLLHSECIDIRKRGSKIESAILHCREGLVEVRARTFIDATGTGEVAVLSGVKSVNNTTYASYRFSMTNVDSGALLDFVKSNRYEFSKVVNGDRDYFFLDGFTETAKKWNEIHPELGVLPSIEISSDTISGNVIVSMIRLPAVDPGRMESVSTAGLSAQTLPGKAAQFLKDHLPGFIGSRILVTPPQFGLHSARRIEGIIPLTYARVMSGESYYDTVGTFPLPGKGPSIFQISRRSLTPAGVSNLLVTGRGILPMAALFSTNNQPASMKLGEAAGAIAAAMQ